MSDFRLLMIGAMYENGGNTTHRFLDGHPQLHVYPFESQIGTRHVNDALTSMFPVKYRWPEFLLDATPEQDYQAIIDEEGKVRSRTPHVSKFRHEPFDMDDDERGEHLLPDRRRDRPLARATTWRRSSARRTRRGRTSSASGEEQVYVGYSPIITVDAGASSPTCPRRTSCTSCATRGRRTPTRRSARSRWTLAGYIMRWNLNQHYALLERERFPGRVHIVRTEDVMADSAATLGALLEGARPAQRRDARRRRAGTAARSTRSIRGARSARPRPEANLATAEPSSTTRSATRSRLRTWQYLDVFGYRDFLADGQAGELHLQPVPA